MVWRNKVHVLCTYLNDDRMTAPLGFHAVCELSDQGLNDRESLLKYLNAKGKLVHIN